MRTKIFIADDDAIFRRSLRFLIEQQPDMEVIGETGNGRTTFNQIRQLSPEVVFTDIKRFVLDGFDLASQITNGLPHVKVIAMSEYPDVHLTLKVLRAGASSYLLKKCSCTDIKNAIYSVMRNERYLTEKFKNLLFKSFLCKPSLSNSPASSLLTKRQLEVLQLITEGKSTKQIALQCYVTVETIDSHRQQIMKKLNINNMAELTKFAIREGLISV